MYIVNESEKVNMSLDELIEFTRNISIEKELWKKICYENHESIYSVSSYGRIRNDKRNKILKQRRDKEDGYLYVNLYDGKKHKNFNVHRIVAIAFCIKRNSVEDVHVHHIDSNKDNNKINNLVWVTIEEHLKIHDCLNYYNPLKGEECPNSLYTNSQIEKLCKLMESNLYTNKQLSELTGVPVSTINSIRCGDIWKSISSKYNIKLLRESNRKVKHYNKDIIRKACRMILDGYSDSKIAKDLSINLTSVNKIRNKKQHIQIFEEEQNKMKGM